MLASCRLSINDNVHNIDNILLTLCINTADLYFHICRTFMFIWPISYFLSWNALNGTIIFNFALKTTNKSIHGDKHDCILKIARRLELIFLLPFPQVTTYNSCCTTGQCGSQQVSIVAANPASSTFPVYSVHTYTYNTWTIGTSLQYWQPWAVWLCEHYSTTVILIVILVNKSVLPWYKTRWLFVCLLKAYSPVNRAGSSQDFKKIQILQLHMSHKKAFNIQKATHTSKARTCWNRWPFTLIYQFTKTTKTINKPNQEI